MKRNKFDKQIVDHWQRKRAATNHARVTDTVLIERGPTRFLVSAPDSPRLNQFAQSNGGRWRKLTHRWSFPNYRFEAVKTLCCNLYGTGRVIVQ